MLKEIKYLIFIVIITLFIFFTGKYYFSDENIKKSYRSLSSIDEKINVIEKDLIFLKNDTENIIEYVEFKNNKKKNKYSFWELLYNDK